MLYDAIVISCVQLLADVVHIKCRSSIHPRYRRLFWRNLTKLHRYGRFFRTRTRDSAVVAGRYLRGLAQADDCTFTAMASVVDESCAQQFQHFISHSPWDHKPVVARIGQDALERFTHDYLPTLKPRTQGRYRTSL
jgi:hypothetical protein